MVAAIIVLTGLTVRGETGGDTGTITATTLNVRGTPSLKAAKVAVLKKGDRIAIHDRVDGWLKISRQQVKGYVLDKEQYVHIESRSTPTGIEQLKKEAQSLDQKIESHKSELEQFKYQQTEILETLDQIDISSNTLKQQIDTLQQKTARINDTIRENQQAAQVLGNKIEEARNYASRRLIALYKLSLTGEMNVLGAADSVYAVLRTKKDIALICDHDTKILTGYLQNRARLMAIMDKLAAEQTEKASLGQTMRQQIDAMNGEKEKRRSILKDIRETESARRAALESLEKAARTLDQTIASLYKEADTDKQLEGTFPSLKGLLPMPVSGTIINEFGKYQDADFKIVNFRSGIDIRAERGEPVRAVFRGEVLFAQWFKGYGNMIIIDHGEKYYTVYAHTQELFKKKGDLVETNEVIATVGDTTYLSNGTVLYFELRHQGKPIDPLTWLDRG